MTNSAIILETRDLSKHFGGLKAVEGVDLRIRQGDLHSIIGSNGAGKTTLFNLLSSTLKPRRGTILLRGEDITSVPAHQMARKGIGRSFQITNIFFSQTVFENVRLAAQAMLGENYRLFRPIRTYAAVADKAMEALDAVGITELSGVPVARLSHGDKRKLELAILLAQDLEILLLDEPTSGLPSESVPEFMALIQRIHQVGNKTTVLVEHNMNVVMSLSDRITVMHQGMILAEGTPAEIASDPNVRSAYLGEGQISDPIDVGDGAG